MQRLEVSGAVRPIYGSLGVKRLKFSQRYCWSLKYSGMWRLAGWLISEVLKGPFSFPTAQQHIVCQGLLLEASRSHSDTPHSIGFLWTNDRPITQASTWYHTILTRDISHAPGGIRNLNPSKRAAAHPHLRTRGHWDQLWKKTVSQNLRDSLNKWHWIASQQVWMYPRCS